MTQYFDGEEFNGSTLKNQFKMHQFYLKEDISLVQYTKVSKNKVFKQDSPLTDFFHPVEEEYASVKFD